MAPTPCPHRLEGLFGASRSGAPRQNDDDTVKHLVALTVEAMPSNATHWSTQSIARQARVSHTTVSQIRRAFTAAPGRNIQAFGRSRLRGQGPRRGRPVSEPARPGPVLCVDEKPQRQALRPTAATLPMRPGQPEHPIQEERAGSCSRTRCYTARSPCRPGGAPLVEHANLHERTRADKLPLNFNTLVGGRPASRLGSTHAHVTAGPIPAMIAPVFGQPVRSPCLVP